jgi:hypothetical protein
MQGVPLGIVDNAKVIALVKKLFEAHDASATFELNFGPPDSLGNRRVNVEISARVNSLFANAVLRGYDPASYNASPDTTRPRNLDTVQPNATPPATTPPSKSSKK